MTNIFLINIFTLIAIAFSTCVTGAPSSFNEAKKLAERIYSDHPKEFYCGCKIKWNRSGRDVPDHASCGYKIRKDTTRAMRIEWEHVVPAFNFGRQRPCWQNGGRDNCQNTDSIFRQMEADLHNLTPAIGEVNGDRSNFQFGVIPGEPKQYGACPMEVDFEDRVAEPRDAIKGDIARIYFYMADRYNLRLSDQQQRLLNAWSKIDPVDDWERIRDKRIAQQMGHSNPFVTGQKTWSLEKEKAVEASSVTHVPATTKPAATAISPSVLKETTAGIRGNTKSRIYHRPDCPSYEAVSTKNRVEFFSAQEAENAGYRLARNCP